MTPAVLMLKPLGGRRHGEGHDRADDHQHDPQTHEACVLFLCPSDPPSIVSRSSDVPTRRRRGGQTSRCDRHLSRIASRGYRRAVQPITERAREIAEDVLFPAAIDTDAADLCRSPISISWRGRGSTASRTRRRRWVEPRSDDHDNRGRNARFGLPDHRVRLVAAPEPGPSRWRRARRGPARYMARTVVSR